MEVISAADYDIDQLIDEAATHLDRLGKIEFADLDLQRYFKMKLIRTAEQKLLSLFSQNKLFGTTHTSIGQEANAVGIMEALDLERDIVWSNHRCHGHFLAYCGNLVGLFAEIMGKADGVSGGRGGSQHICFRNFYSNGIQGGITPLAVGCALAEKQNGAICTVFIGDGTLGEGVLYESLNMAALWAAPILFVVENNGIAQTTPSALALSGNPSTRAKSFGIECVDTTTTDVQFIADTARDLVGHVRRDGRPIWWHINTVRLGPHSKGDDTRSPQKLEALWALDPIAIQATRTNKAHQIDELCERLVDEATAHAASLAVSGRELQGA